MESERSCSVTMSDPRLMTCHNTTVAINVQLNALGKGAMLTKLCSIWMHGAGA